MKHNPSVPIIIKNFIDGFILPQVNSMNLATVLRMVNFKIKKRNFCSKNRYWYIEFHISWQTIGNYFFSINQYRIYVPSCNFQEPE